MQSSAKRRIVLLLASDNGLAEIMGGVSMSTSVPGGLRVPLALVRRANASTETSESD